MNKLNSSFLLISVDFTCLFFSNSTLEWISSYDLPGTRSLSSSINVPCFEIEGNGLGLAAWIILPLEAVCVAEVDGVDS
jgi:hypothetical protein